MTPCNVCGGGRFAPGPGGRRTPAGHAPRCETCGSLERHRALRARLSTLDRKWLAAMDVLQLSADPSIDRSWFRHLTTSRYGGPGRGLDVEHIALPSASFDLVICCHVLEHVRRDDQALRELARVTRPSGSMMVMVPSIAQRRTTEDWGYADRARDGHYRTYGRESLATRLRTVLPRHRAAFLPLRDPVTGVRDLAVAVTRSNAVIKRFGPAAP